MLKSAAVLAMAHTHSVFFFPDRTATVLLQWTHKHTYITHTTHMFTHRKNRCASHSTRALHTFLHRGAEGTGGQGAIRNHADHVCCISGDGIAKEQK